MMLTEDNTTPHAELFQFVHQLFTSELDKQGDIAIFTAVELAIREFYSTATPVIPGLSDRFRDYLLPEEMQCPSSHFTKLLTEVLPGAVNTYSPRFIGHMTSALPRFVVPLANLLMQLNQNVVKLETSGVFTSVERQLVQQFHHLVYQYEPFFYKQNNAEHLGSFCSGGTIANLTALWYARNAKFKGLGDAGLKQLGLIKATQALGYNGLAIIVSERAHYSLRKAADLLGLGTDFLVTVPVDEQHKIRLDLLEQKCQHLTINGIAIVAIVGVAGATETGSIDPLSEMADIAYKYHCHFHVDAAWGGATLFSDKYRRLLAGVSRADSVTIDAHKQMYTPIGVGMVLFKHPVKEALIQYSAEYIIRPGSADLGCCTLEGSRPAMSLFLYSALQILGKRGYEYLINQSIEKARAFALMIQSADDFELISEPELCILTYRYVPMEILKSLVLVNDTERGRLNDLLNQLTIAIQEKMKDIGHSFVSRTSLTYPAYGLQRITVFRVVLANPLTTCDILEQILDEQRVIAKSFQDLLQRLNILNKNAISGWHKLLEA